MSISQLQAQLNALTQTSQVVFSKTYAAMDTSMLNAFSMKNPSNKESENYQGLGAVPKVREFKDERQVKRIYGKAYAIYNKKWESTVEVPREDVERDSTGDFMNKVRQMAGKAAQHPWERMMDFIDKGHGNTYGTCYDGQYFFDTDHAEGESGSQSNIVTGTGTTIDKVEADFDTAKKQMRQLKDDRGEPFFGDMELNGQLGVLVPSYMEGVVDKLFNAREISGTTNTKYGKAKVYVSNRLTVDDNWYVFVIDSMAKAMIYQLEKAVELMSQVNANSNYDVFMRDKYLFGTYARYELGYGLWQMGQKVKNT